MPPAKPLLALGMAALVTSSQLNPRVAEHNGALRIVENDSEGALAIHQVIGGKGAAVTFNAQMRSFAHAMRENRRREREELIQRYRKMQQEAREAPYTWVGGVFLPLLVLGLCWMCVLRVAAPAAYERQTDVLLEAVEKGPAGRWARRARDLARRRGWSLHDVTRIFVTLFFVHEGLSVFQLKWAQLEESQQGMVTPFGIMHALPPWEKSDAQDMILLFVSLATLFNLLPTVGCILLLVDVATDTLDLAMRILLTWMMQGGVRVNELTAKKLSLLGVTALVATHRWRNDRAVLADVVRRQQRQQPPPPPPPPPSNGGGGSPRGSPRKAAAASDAGPDGDGTTLGSHVAVAVPALVLLVGRLLMASVFFYAAAGELLRVVLPTNFADLDPNDPHNVLWPKLVELALAVPFTLGLRTTATARALAATLAVEALTCWPFWAFREQGLEQRLHAREHFCVNVAIAGGLLLVQQVGGGRYAVDELLKKAS